MRKAFFDCDTIKRNIDKRINVTTVFYESKLMHEYQFNLSTTHEDERGYSLETLVEVFKFLEEIYL